MRNPDAVFEFKLGRLVALVSDKEWPDWFRDAMLAERETDERERALSDQGAENIESYGRMNESVDVWRRLDYGWLVDWWDTDSHVMTILIDNLVDYANFQAAWVCPMATKIIAADRYITESVITSEEAERDTAVVH